MLRFCDATIDDIPVIQEIAEETWWPTYSPILNPEQLRYMLDTIYSPEKLSEVITNGSQKFILLVDSDRAEGFASYGERQEDPSVFKLHKLYVRPGNHGKGYGRRLVDEIRERVVKSGASAIDLNVNRFNPARKFYEKYGFRVIKEEDVPIGPYFMNDYVMRFDL